MQMQKMKNRVTLVDYVSTDAVNYWHKVHRLNQQIILTKNLNLLEVLTNELDLLKQGDAIWMLFCFGGILSYF